MKPAILATALAALTTLSADAALITWGAAQDVTGDSDVSTAGTLVGAINTGSLSVLENPTTTVNGVTFTQFAASSSSPTFSLAGNLLVASGFNPGPSPFLSLSTPYQGLMRSGLADFSIANTGGSFTLTLSGLVIGDLYEFQFWSALPGFVPGATLTATTGVNSITLDSNTTDGPGGLGQFAIGTFVADSATQVISFANSTNFGVLSAAQLRNLTPQPETPAAVPEPGTALAGVMLAGLLGLRRRRGVTRKLSSF